MISNYHESKEMLTVEKLIPYDNKLAPFFIRDRLYKLIPEGTEHIYIVGIGSNKINGDSLGPFVGTLLEGLYANHVTVSGTLRYPLDAETLESELKQISFPDNSFVIAIDSVLGTERFVNSIMIRNGAMQPGEGVGNCLLPKVGDCCVMGVVLHNVPEETCSLFLTDLHLIYSMAMTIAKGISLTVRQYFQYPSHQPLLGLG
ncbi:spore protease YyaC [Bacillus tuaregi]|uniref:spore protease YyaC n=1 Tax=Bacillus tuaregi TaxID=1816695 RepID=UPI000A004C58|nr:spore protease YyaC [Bacillus tuaregi]